MRIVVCKPIAYYFVRGGEEMNFSEHVSKALLIRGLKKSDLARLAGYSLTHISDLLRGERRWNEKSIEKVCTALGLEIRYQLIENDSKERNREEKFNETTTGD